MLRVIEGGTGEIKPLRGDDLPLGPWAGAQVRVWATKTGKRWHADPDCSSLTSRARTEVFVQPTEGTLGQRRLPADLHCQPAGPLAQYLGVTQAVVRFAAETDDAERQWDNGDIALSALPGRHGYGPDPTERSASDDELSSTWAREWDRRLEWIQRVDGRLAPSGEWLPVMALADWVRRGRTPREHQPRYDRLVRIAADEFAAMGLTNSMGTRRYVNSDCLPDWLDDIVGGRTCENATATMVEREYNDALHADHAGDGELPERVREVWRRIGGRWEQMLEAMACAHPGVVLALFSRYGTDVDHDLLDVCIRRGRSAQLRVGHLDWAVAVVPAACRLGLAERDHGLGGLVLLEGPLYGVDEACCERFLRNLLTSLDHPELAAYIAGPAADGQDGNSDELPEADFEAGLELHQLGFGVEGWGRHLTVARCAPALRAALQGAELQQVTTSPSRRRRPSRSGRR